MSYHLSALALAALLWSTAAMSMPPASRSGTFHLDSPPQRAFALFTAQGERRWAPGWDPEILSGDVERGSVFRTRSHDRTVVWIVSAYDAGAQRVSYARLVDGMNMGLVDVSCEAADGGTQVTVRYTLTPLSEAGQHNIAHLLDAQHYAAFMEEWRAAITAALRRDDEAD